MSKDPSARRFDAQGLKIRIYDPCAVTRCGGSSQTRKRMPEIQSEQDFLTWIRTTTGMEEEVEGSALYRVTQIASNERRAIPGPRVERAVSVRRDGTAAAERSPCDVTPVSYTHL